MEKKNQELTYLNDDGNTVFTSKYHLNRGSCCKTGCLHCPYGFTLKNQAIKIIDMQHKHIKYANEIVRDTMPVEQGEVASMLLASAFGTKEKIRIHHITEENYNRFSFGEFKGVICAVIEFSTKLSESSSGRQVKEIYLKKEFQNQGLGKEHIL
ncbi:MAG: DUF5522 domain-containing protein [Bacteriovoracaceae bacterium]